ncbi:DUF934 domain-containing protein [Terrarubrum flagellatum]|uniref:DUF934 domain-containing protein n=1 Tax=Terrirubrum flagellatum TaxID=2895980 RepID=UPI0031453E98
MPLLDRSGFKPDAYVRVEDGAIDGVAFALVPWAKLGDALTAKGRDQRIGVEIPNSISIAELKLNLRQLSLVSIIFPSFSDGRGFSLARHLRNHGFTGVVRATGPLIADQFSYALSCGFDEIDLPEASAARQPWPQWEAALRSISHGYQRGYGDGANILEQRRARRREAAQEAPNVA